MSNLPVQEIHWNLWIKRLIGLAQGLHDVSLNALQILQDKLHQLSSCFHRTSCCWVSRPLTLPKKIKTKKYLNQNGKSFKFRTQPKSLVWLQQPVYQTFASISASSALSKRAMGYAQGKQGRQWEQGDKYQSTSNTSNKIKRKGEFK